MDKSIDRKLYLPFVSALARDQLTSYLSSCYLSPSPPPTVLDKVQLTLPISTLALSSPPPTVLARDHLTLPIASTVQTIVKSGGGGTVAPPNPLQELEGATQNSSYCIFSYGSLYSFFFFFFYRFVCSVACVAASRELELTGSI